MTGYTFEDMDTDELAKFARNPPNDLEANERKRMIEELVERMVFWYHGANL